MDKQKIKYSLVKLTSIIPFFKKNKIFISYHNKENLTGPGRFVHNIENIFNTSKLYFERIFIGKCKAILIISRIPPSFYDFCKRKHIKTFLRVDGFSLPILYDNTNYDYRDFREFTYTRIIANQEIQVGLYKSDFIIYQSEFSKYIADMFLYKRTSNYAIIHNGVDIDIFKPRKNNRGNKLVLGVLGTLRDVDIIRTSLEVHKRLHSSFSNIELMLIGTIKPEVNDFVIKWKNSYPEISDKIHLTRTLTINELPTYINMIDISLHLTFGDACPNAVLENMACGNPIICPKWGGASELVGDAGMIIDHQPYYYDEDYIDKIADCVIRLEKQLSIYSIRARQRVIEYFSLKKMGEEYYKVINNYD